ncbi:DNA primase [Vibrio phage vB_VhaP_PG11]|nr:DNA primase [Vibrio phage vB_VhaP_PG11]
MELLTYDEMDYHPIQEQMLQILRKKTQNVESDLYFRAVISFYLAQMASSQRATIKTPHRGDLPVNMFVCALMESGAGKGYSMNIIEHEIIAGFSDVFTKQTFPSVAEQSIADEARKKAVRNQTDEAEELEALQSEFSGLGAMPYSFDSGTGPAYKQVRTKAQMAKIGSLNMICDEIGTNLLGNSELFAVNLEAYDVGRIKQKITKNSSENKRSEERTDPVPSNMLVFGTPSKLFNGGMEEREYRSMLETGYGRRFLYGWGQKSASSGMTAEELYQILTDMNQDGSAAKLALRFEALADEINFNKKIQLDKDVTLINLQYQLNCEEAASKLSVFEPIKKAELQHRYFKAMKLAGVYAFIDGTDRITADQMYSAIKLVEDSGKACEQILSQDRNYVRLAKYIAAVGKELTYADLVEELPFFSGSKSAKDDMMSLARQWGHRNNVVIKKAYDGDIEFFKGETLKETDLDNLIFSVSNDVAYNYHSSTSYPQIKSWDKLSTMVTQNGVHWCNHNFQDKHRREDNAIPEFNMVVIDVDDGCSLDTAKFLLKDYKALYYTTKRHTEQDNRFRIVIPLKYHLKMSDTEYKEFMNNLFEWLPFKVDEGTNQRCKKWLSYSDANSICEYTEGEILDPSQFIPKTAKNERRLEEAQNIADMDRTEAWFARSIADGNRNNTILKYTMMLFDGGMEPQDVEDRVKSFNEKLKNGLSVDELRNTVFKTLWQKANETGRI